MRVVETSRDAALIELKEREVVVLNNALNEICHGLDIEEFATRIGAEKEEVEILLSSLHELPGRLADTVEGFRG